MKTTLVWFRQDLRVADHPALLTAVARGGAVVPVYVWSPEEEGGWAPGAASRWWLHESLQRLAASLAAIGSPLVLRAGPAADTLLALARETGADAVYWNRRHEPAAVDVEADLRGRLASAGIDGRDFQSALLSEPRRLLKGDGDPYRVFTPYWRAFTDSVEVGPPQPSPRALQAPARAPASLPVDALRLLPSIPWHESLARHWTPGESAARDLLRRFVQVDTLGAYGDTRDRPDRPATSRLSPYLHFGEVSPRQVWTAIGKASERAGLTPAQWRTGKFCAELVWREFAAQLLHHFPTMPERSRTATFDAMPWRSDPAHFRAWTRGRTGYAFVDAGMRELWQTGWMHNRVRMVTASFLVKNLLHRWQDGARWFWDTLVDADLASNSMNWQWVAGSSPDAAPFFRIFNPESQADKFDPDGHYRREFVPEAGGPGAVPPLVDLKRSRQQALDAFATLRAKEPS
jgi:deoxyribodipyrimidine photo-lyase